MAVVVFSNTEFLVYTFTTPPPNSPGSSGEPDLKISTRSNTELGRMSDENERISTSAEGVRASFSSTVLYRSAKPRITMKLLLCTVTPGMRFTTSAASRSSDFTIWSLLMPLTTTSLFFRSCIRATSVPVCFTPVTVTSVRLVVLSCITPFSVLFLPLCMFTLSKVSGW